MSVASRLAASLASTRIEQRKELDAICMLLGRPTENEDDAAEVLVPNSRGGIRRALEALRVGAARLKQKRAAERVGEEGRTRRALALWSRATRRHGVVRARGDRSAARRWLGALKSAFHTRLQKRRRSAGAVARGRGAREGARRAKNRALRRAIAALASHAAARRRAKSDDEIAAARYARATKRRALRRVLERGRERRSRRRRGIIAAGRSDMRAAKAALATFAGLLERRRVRLARREVARAFRRSVRAKAGVAGLRRWRESSVRNRREREAVAAMWPVRARLALRVLRRRVDASRRARAFAARRFLRKLRAAASRRQRAARAEMRWRDRAIRTAVHALAQSRTRGRLAATLDSLAERTRISRALLALRAVAKRRRSRSEAAEARRHIEAVRQHQALRKLRHLVVAKAPELDATRPRRRRRLQKTKRASCRGRCEDSLERQAVARVAFARFRAAIERRRARDAERRARVAACRAVRALWRNRNAAVVQRCALRAAAAFYCRTLAATAFRRLAATAKDALISRCRRTAANLHRSRALLRQGMARLGRYARLAPGLRRLVAASASHSGWTRSRRAMHTWLDFLDRRRAERLAAASTLAPVFRAWRSLAANGHLVRLKTASSYELLTPGDSSSEKTSRHQGGPSEWSDLQGSLHHHDCRVDGGESAISMLLKLAASPNETHGDFGEAA